MFKRLLSLVSLSAVLTLSLVPSTFAASEPNFKLRYQGQNAELTLEAIGIDVSRNSELSWSGNFFASVPFLERILAKENYVFDWSPPITEKLIREQFNVDKPRNARYVFSNGAVAIQNEATGTHLDIEELVEDITDDYPFLRSYDLVGKTPDLITKDELEVFRETQETLLTRGLKVNVLHEEFTFPAQMKDVSVIQNDDGVYLSLNGPYLEYVLNTLTHLTDIESSDLTILEASLDGVNYATTEGYVLDGQALNRENTERALQNALKGNSADAVAVSETIEGEIHNESGVNLGPLDQIASGISNFKGSPYGRDFNIRRGLNTKYHNVIIPQGAEFSYNALLGPVTYSAGWKGSLAIFGGKDLRTVPGGGLCQVSTTMYRAALDAGLDITAQRNHSLYVHYYAEYGDGLDATIFPGSQDLKFVNNTGGPILVEAYDDGYDAIVNFYGTDDGRVTYLNGPYTVSNQPEESITGFRSLGYNEILWEYIISFPDGRTEREWLLSRYRTNVKQY